MVNKNWVWSGFILTDAGLRLRQEVIAEGGELAFSRAEIGEGKPSNEGQVAGMKALILPKETVQVVKSSLSGEGNHVLLVAVDNAEFAQEVLMTEVGVYAKKKDTNTEVLYGYSYCTAGYSHIPPGASSHYRHNISFDTKISRATEVKIVVDGQGVFVDYEELDTALGKKVDGQGQIYFSLEELGLSVSSSMEDIHRKMKTNSLLRTGIKDASQDQYPYQHGFLQVEKDAFGKSTFTFRNNLTEGELPLCEWIGFVSSQWTGWLINTVSRANQTSNIVYVSQTRGSDVLVPNIGTEEIPYKTISMALSQVSDSKGFYNHTEISVEKGDYEENIEVVSANSRIQIYASEPSTVTVWAKTSERNNIVTALFCPFGIVLDGIRFEGLQGKTEKGIYSEYSSVTTKNCEIAKAKNGIVGSLLSKNFSITSKFESIETNAIQSLLGSSFASHNPRMVTGTANTLYYADGSTIYHAGAIPAHNVLKKEINGGEVRGV